MAKRIGSDAQTAAEHYEASLSNHGNQLVRASMRTLASRKGSISKR